MFVEKAMSIHGGDIYRNPGVLDFSANCNCFGMPASVREAAVQGVQCANAYPDPECEALREAIADYEDVEATQILCGNGASELLLAITTALQPKRVLLAAPCFLEYERVLMAASAKIEWHLLSEKEGYVPRETFLDALQKTDADMVILSNPNNPTGALLSSEYMEQIVRITKERKITLILDECFLDFLDEPERYSAKQHLDSDSFLIVLKAFTKTFACAGLRIGYLLCMNKEILCNCKSHLPEWNVSLPATYAGIAASKERAWLSETSAKIRVEREWLRAQLTKLGFHVYPGAANFLFFTGEAGLYAHCLSQGILIRDCSNYRGMGSGSYRVCVRRHEENVRFLQVIEGWKENLIGDCEINS